MHHSIADESSRTPHLGHRILRRPHQCANLATNLLHQPNNLQGGISQQRERNQRGQGSQNHKNIDERLADKECENDEHDDDDNATNGKGNLNGSLPPRFASCQVYHGTCALLLVCAQVECTCSTCCIAHLFLP
jgi:hypothetical protein